MRTTIIAILSLVLTSGCSRPDKCNSERLNCDINKIAIEGHEYLYNYKGGIIHSMSCPCLANDSLSLSKTN